MKRLKTVLFDLDDTLCDDSSAWVVSANGAAQLAVKRGVTVDAGSLVNAFLKVSEAYWMSFAPVNDSRPLIEIRTDHWATALANAYGLVDFELAADLAKEYGERRSREVRLYPDAVETLITLRENGLKLALLTNGVQLTHVDKIKHLGLEVLFDHLLIADIVGSFKPDRMIFEEALHRCGCVASEAAMVGDHLRNDIGGAQAVGISGYWFNPNGLTVGLGDPVPSAQISKLSELIEMLEPRLS